MDGVKTIDTGAFEPVVFEAIHKTVPGGVTLDTSGLAATYPDGIPAGTLIGRKDGTTGLCKLVVITPASPDTYSAAPLGLLRKRTAVKNNTLAAVVVGGVVRIDALPAAVKTGWDDLIKALPELTFV